MSNSTSSQGQSQAVAQQSETFVSSLLVTFDKRSDKHLVWYHVSNYFTRCVLSWINRSILLVSWAIVLAYQVVLSHIQHA